MIQIRDTSDGSRHWVLILKDYSIFRQPTNYPHLRGTFRLAENLVPGVPGLSADAVYDKSLIREFGDLIDPEGAFVQAKINYAMAPAVISFIYQLTYLSATDEWDITSGLETTITF